MRTTKLAMSAFATALLSVALVGCESTDEGSNANPLDFGDLPDAGEQERAGSRASAAAARTEMERVLTDRVYDADEIDLDLMDFGEADRLYQEAIASDPKNTEAQFGAAIAHLLALSVNEDVRAVQDSVDAYMEDDDMASAANKVARLPLIPAKMTLQALADPLTVSDLQATVNEEIIPAIDYALDRLTIVEGDSEFTFVLTPAMMGDEDEDPLEIDLGEAYMLDAQLRLLKGVLLVTTAYDFDFDMEGKYEWLEEYPSDENVLRHLVRFDKTGTFMTLKSADSMRNAKAEILTAIGKMETGLETIRAETDDQDDDLIRREDIEDLDAEIDLSEEGDDTPLFFREIRSTDDLLSKAREALESTVEIEADFDGDEGTPKSTIVFDLGSFFDDPIEDLRALLPHHTWHLELLDNRDFSDELVVTDAAGVALGTSPPVLFPDPSFGGILSNVSTNQQLLDLFGIDAEGVNDQDLLYEIGLLDYRDGGLIVTNAGSGPVDVVYSGYVGDGFVEDHTVSVAAGAQGVDVVRSEFDLPVDGDEWLTYSVRRDGAEIFADQMYVFGNIYLTISETAVTMEKADHDVYYDDPANPYVSTTVEIGN